MEACDGGGLHPRQPSISEQKRAAADVAYVKKSAAHAASTGHEMIDGAALPGCQPYLDVVVVCFQPPRGTSLSGSLTSGSDLLARRAAAGPTSGEMDNVLVVPMRHAKNDVLQSAQVIGAKAAKKFRSNGLPWVAVPPDRPSVNGRRNDLVRQRPGRAGMSVRRQLRSKLPVRGKTKLEECYGESQHGLRYVKTDVRGPSYVVADNDIPPKNATERRRSVVCQGDGPSPGGCRQSRERHRQ